MLWMGISGILGVLTSLLWGRYLNRRIKKQLGTWAQEDKDRVDKINKQLGGRDD